MSSILLNLLLISINFGDHLYYFCSLFIRYEWTIIRRSKFGKPPTKVIFKNAMDTVLFVFREYLVYFLIGPTSKLTKMSTKQNAANFILIIFFCILYTDFWRNVHAVLLNCLGYFHKTS